MTDSILVVGGGLSGLTAALHCANAGARVTVIERDAVVGGKRSAAMTQKSSAGDFIDGVPLPKLAAVAENSAIELLTLADVTAVEGTPGNFDVSIRQQARFVTDACTRCNNCKPVCPQVLPNEYEAGLSYRKAIFTPHIETLPEAFAIDIDACLNTPPNYLPCNRCIEACDDDAIFFDVPLQQSCERKVGAIVIAAGDEVSPIEESSAFGYGDNPDVVTADELECLLTAPGPTGGFVARPSDEAYPSSMLVVLDELSPTAVYTVTSQLRRLVEQRIDTIVLLVTVKPGNDDKAALLGKLPAGIDVRFGLLQNVDGGEEGLAATWVDFVSNEVPEVYFDMVVLGSDTRPPAGIDDLAANLGVELAASGYVDVDETGATSRPGVYAAGSVTGPAVIGESYERASAAAAAALTHLDPRVLGIDVANVAAVPGAAGVTEEELRGRIERALYSILDSGD